jgi:hypothetical protein
MLIPYRDDLGASPVILDTDMAVSNMARRVAVLHELKSLEALTKAIALENRIKKARSLNDPDKVKIAVFEYRSVTREAQQRIAEKTHEYSAGQRLEINELDMAYHLLNPQLIEGWPGKITNELIHALKQECLFVIQCSQLDSSGVAPKARWATVDNGSAQIL